MMQSDGVALSPFSCGPTILPCNMHAKRTGVVARLQRSASLLRSHRTHSRRVVSATPLRKSVRAFPHNVIFHSGSLFLRFPQL